MISPSESTRSGRGNGFTLIELMVSIAIVLILAALLTTGVRRAKQAVWETRCQSNHRQLMLAWHLYAAEHDDALPWTVDDGEGIPFTNWVAGSMSHPLQAISAWLLVDANRSLFSRYITTPETYKCPADRSDHVRSVSMNNRMNPIRFSGPPLAIGGWGTNFMVYRRLGDIRQPSSIFVFIDERSDSINEGNFAIDLSNTGDYSGEGTPSPYWWIDTPAGHHLGAGMLSFADGHVERHLWLEPSTLGPLGVTGPRHTSATDRDIAWLQARTAERR
ncbi:MAG TPA: type II secretion system protein [Methylomirabilota bacterium]|nr:type II secretion system protein [Methylomirabilota bacterium]